MFTILVWIASTLLESVSTSTYKKSLELSNMSKVMFKLYASFFGIPIYIILFLIIWMDLNIIKDFTYILVILITTIIYFFGTMIELKIYMGSYLTPTRKRIRY